MKKSKEKGANKVVLTGGHAATTALATIEELIRRNALQVSLKRRGGWDICWIGAKRAIEGKSVPTLESKIFPEMGIRSYPIISGRLQRKFTLWTLPSVAKIPFGFLHALFLLLKIRPKIILSFGGFAAFPVVVAGFILRIPVVIHEQTMAAGRASKYSAPFARMVALAREESKKFFPKAECKVIGNPLLTQIAEIKPKEKIGEPVTIFIVGGSRGSRTINKTVSEIIERLLNENVVIHQTGFLDYEKMQEVRNSLAKNLREKYELYPVIDPMDIDGVYKRADIVVARAGANTVAEIIAIKRPAVLIPIPWSYENEQVKNAEFAEKFGLAKVLDQQQLTSAKLLKSIKDIENNWKNMVEKTKGKKSPDINAAEKLVDLLEVAVR
ncbi:MAG: UDP-N-acetylglucosamine--N-acetylmuramyl-(pentapeptide) pyrophosphoryl-undecaprenol N-acetylglucosamine transferase [Microgenomates group bacterium]